MHNKRLKIFALFCVCFAAVCVIRLAYIQLNPHSAWQGQLEKIRTGRSKQLPALRGRILDRNGKVLAVDEAKFAMCIDYKYARLADERFWKSQLLEKIDDNGQGDIAQEIRDEYMDDFNSLNQIISICSQFREVDPGEIKEEINTKINEPIWKIRYYLAWKRKYPNEEFEKAEPDADKRLLLAADVDIAEMHQSQELFKLENDDEVVAAQLKFIDIQGVTIQPRAERYYPYKNSAAQLIGWVRPASPEDNDNIEDDLQRYMYGDYIGFAGAEDVYEPELRGKRGRIIYNIDGEVASKTDTVYGQDIHLTIDIDLQQKIEKILENKNINPKFGNPAAVVVIDVNSADILAMVSLPDFDLNRARYDYSKLLNDANGPLINRVLNKNYPPGSTAKPVMLAIGLTEQKITSEEVISCPSERAPKGWPRCWIEKTHGYGHDGAFAYEGGNIARNAIKGSCNIYFSHLAARIPPDVLQEWLLRFGFGGLALVSQTDYEINSFLGSKITLVRTFRQSSGIISSNTITDGDMKPIDSAERRFFGIGQGNFRATVLQVADVFAAFSRSGFFKKARLTLEQPTVNGYGLGLSESTLSTIYDGMYAVVNESGGTANTQFYNSGFEDKGIKVYGKTGSTEWPYNAWFAGFAQDRAGNSIAFAILVEGGEHGSSDAGPIARDVVDICLEAGYLEKR